MGKRLIHNFHRHFIHKEILERMCVAVNLI